LVDLAPDFGFDFPRLAGFERADVFLEEDFFREDFCLVGCFDDDFLLADFFCDDFFRDEFLLDFLGDREDC
jgi:hypothetical protein